MHRFWEVEESVKTAPWNMNGLHSHTHYEIYYLKKGTREYFFTNTSYHIEAPCIIIVPPYTMHMTEGGPFERVNLDVSEDSLNEYQKVILAEKSTKILKPTEEQAVELERLFKEMIETDRHGKHADDILDALFGYTFYVIDKIESPNMDSVSFEKSYIPPLVLKAVNYLNVSYGENHTLDSLSKRFFVSKATIMYNFNKYLHCPPMDYLLMLRLSKAKEELMNTEKSIKEISESCGFSSPNYFSLIFKRKENISPGNYRKYQNTKR
jgi:AraC-like DNA-binding protein